ncbi:hypothetical protein [Rhodococcus sp. NPDC049939]
MMASLDEGVTAMVSAVEKEADRVALPGLEWQGIDLVLRFLPHTWTSRLV